MIGSGTCMAAANSPICRGCAAQRVRRATDGARHACRPLVRAPGSWLPTVDQASHERAPVRSPSPGSPSENDGATVLHAAAKCWWI